MSKRLLFKNKIVRFYEEDIWGIFYKKQQRRDLFLKRFSYIFFLSRFIKEIKKRWRLRKSLKIIIKHNIYINLRFSLNKKYRNLKKKNSKFKINSSKFFKKDIKKFNFRQHNLLRKKLGLQRKSALNYSFFWPNLKLKEIKKNIINILLLKKFKLKKDKKKVILYNLLNYSKNFIILKKNILFFKYLYKKTLKKRINKILLINKNINFLYFIRLKYNNNNIKSNYFFNFINFFFIYLNYNVNNIYNILKKEQINLLNYKRISLKTIFILKYKQQINLRKFVWKYIYFSYLKLNFKNKQNNFIFNYLNLMLNKKKDTFIIFNKINNSTFNYFYNSIIFSYFINNIYFNKYLKKNLIISSLILKDFNIVFKLFKLFKLYKLNNKYFFNLSHIIDISEFFFKYFNNIIINLLNFNNKYIYYLNLSKQILLNFSLFNKWILYKFLNLKFKKFKKKKIILFCLYTLFNFIRWLKRKITRFTYKVRNFHYHKYNNFEDSDSLLAGNRFDLTKIDTNFIKTDKDKKRNFILLNALANLKKKKNKFKFYVPLSKVITKPGIIFNKTEYLLSFYASNNLYKFYRKLKVNYIKSMLLRRSDLVNKEKYKLINKKNKNLLLFYSKYLNTKINNISRKERFYSVKKKKTNLQRMFTLNLVPIVKFIKKKKTFNSFYTYKMSKVWKIRKFYGCLTNYEFKRICIKALKYNGNVLIRFLILLESRLDTLLFRSGMVSSIFEARQVINHNLVLVNNRIINKRSYNLKQNEILSICNNKINLFIKSLILRINKQNLLFRPPIYLEVNYKFYLITFLYNVININNIPYNFNIKGNDLNTILYYYY